MDEKTVLITGSSSGIGAAIAETFAKHYSNNINIGLHYSNNKKGALEVAENIKNLANVKIYQADFLSEVDLVHRFVKDFGKIDVLINNAGIFSPKSILDIDITDYDKIFKINSRSAFFLARDAFKYMKENKSGKIINISAVAIKYGRGRNDSIQYAASKATLEVLTKGLSIMGAEHNILVNSIRPGVIMTKIHENRPDIDKRINMIPIKRAGKVEDIANLAVYLASEKGDFITGETFTVGGGE